MRKERGALVTGVIGASISPLAGDGLDEAFGFAVGLGAVWSGEVVSEVKFSTGMSEEPGAVCRAAIGEEALDLDAVESIKVNGLVKGIEDAGNGFIWEEAGKGEAGVIIDGDVETFDAGVAIAQGAIAGGTDARALEAAQLLDVE
jgi:hypothetical protein